MLEKSLNCEIFPSEILKLCSVMAKTVPVYLIEEMDIGYHICKKLL